MMRMPYPINNRPYTSMPCPLTMHTIDVTDNLDFVRDTMITMSPVVKIISMSEDGALPLDHPMVLGGTCMLPPIDALIAKEDGDERKFDAIYSAYLQDQSVSEFVSALIIYLYMQGNLLLYVPSMKEITIQKFLAFFWNIYGIGIGEIGKYKCTYNLWSSPMWLSILYAGGYISANEMLYYYPLEALIPDDIMLRLAMELHPYGDNTEEKVKYILERREKVRKYPRLINPVRCS